MGQYCISNAKSLLLNNAQNSHTAAHPFPKIFRHKPVSCNVFFFTIVTSTSTKVQQILVINSF